MKLKNLTRLLVVFVTAVLVSFLPAFKFFGSIGQLGTREVAAEDCPTGPCPLPACPTTCASPPVTCPECTVVTPCNMLEKGWAVQILTDSETCPSTGTFSFQTGPQCAPAMTGSAKFDIGPDGASDVRFRNSNFDGTKLSDLTALSYYTYIQVAKSPFVAPYLALTLDLNGNGVFDDFLTDDVIFFEPVYQDGTYQACPGGSSAPVQGPVASCTWQSWHAIDGFWWSGADLLAAGGNIPCFTTIPDYLNRPGHGNAKILNPSNCGGGVRISAGEGRGPWDCFIGNVDKFTIAVGNSVPAQTVTYDFEPADCPIPDCGSSPETGLTACKFYDKNANGIQDPEDIPLPNWPITLDPLTVGATPHLATQLTSTDGCVSWGNLFAGVDYTVSEGTPNESSWAHSTPTSVVVTPILNNQSQVKFGNYCRVRSGGNTIGFWGNKNGQALINAADLLALRTCHLVNADGSAFDPTTAKQVDTWLKGASATNMAYMLSAQLAAMKLNVAHGFVNGNNTAICAGTSINQLIMDADALLAADSITLAGDPNRAAQEAAKNCLDSLNNGAFVVLPTPCTYTFQNQARQQVVGGPARTSVSTPLNTPRYPRVIVP